MSYQDTLLTWHDFYLACAAASATFAGLLFVALSLHLRIVVTHPEARSLARITLIQAGCYPRPIFTRRCTGGTATTSL